MTFLTHYDSPLGGVLLAADESGLTGLWFEGQKYFADNLPAERAERETETLALVKRWLDIYFAGKEPDFMPPLHPVGSPLSAGRYGSFFWSIPYGQTATYGELSPPPCGEQCGIAHMSAQAVGGAVGHNRYFHHHSLPSGGGYQAAALTGYAGGVDKKREAAGAGTGGYARFLRSEKGNGALKRRGAGSWSFHPRLKR